MAVKKLDRTPVRLREALTYVRAEEPDDSGAVMAPAMAMTRVGSYRPAHPAPPWANIPESDARAREALVVALRDGDLHARGRYSDTPTAPWEHAHPGRRWMLHSGYHSSIAPEAWCSGSTNVTDGTLTLADGQFIDIVVPRFMLLAIWPPAEPPCEQPKLAAAEGGYTTPYLDLLRQAIVEHGITDGRQSKKEILAAWFREQVVDGEQVSSNLANVMATLVRLPSSQKGGNRKWTDD